MSKVERFFHVRPFSSVADGYGVRDVISSRGGATVRVIGGTDIDTIAVQIAYCSANDAFCRKTGREVAEKHPMFVTHTTDLPKVLQEVARTVCGRVLKLSHSKRRQHHLWNTDYSFAMKYFEPKKEQVSA